MWKTPDRVIWFTRVSGEMYEGMERRTLRWISRTFSTGEATMGKYEQDLDEH
jgi:hypothetical protein